MILLHTHTVSVASWPLSLRCLRRWLFFPSNLGLGRHRPKRGSSPLFSTWGFVAAAWCVRHSTESCKHQYHFRQVTMIENHWEQVNKINKAQIIRRYLQGKRMEKGLEYLLSTCQMHWNQTPEFLPTSRPRNVKKYCTTLHLIFGAARSGCQRHSLAAYIYIYIKMHIYTYK